MKLFAIALNTYREAVRDKILYTLLFFALAMIGMSALVADLTLGEFDKVLKDFGLSSISIFGLAISIFVGVGLVYKEIDRKTIYTIASKPVARWEFVVGKYLGLALTLAVEVLVMCLAFFGVLAAYGVKLQVTLGSALWLSFVEMLVVMAVAVTFSCFSSPALSSLFSVGITVVGKLTPELQALGQRSESARVKALLDAAYYVLPDLSTFNLRDHASWSKPVEWEFVAYATGYGALWVVALLVLSALIFQRRDFK